MKINLTLNGKRIEEEIRADLLLIDFVREHGCFSVKRGCETSGCGLCTVFLDEKPVLSCSVLAAGRWTCSDYFGRTGRRKQKNLGHLLQIREQSSSGFCNPGMIMNAIALFRENPDPTDEEMKEYLAGNLCRCSGYEGQLRGMKAFLEYKKQGGTV